QHLQCTLESGSGKRVRVETDVQRPVDALLLAVEADRLSNREDVCLIEGVLERTAAMPGSTEHHALRGHGWIGSARIVSVHQLRNIDQNRRLGRFPCFRTDVHDWFLFRMRPPQITM